MIKHHCNLYEPWLNNDFSTCFRETVIDGFLIVILLAWTLIVIGKEAVKYYKSHFSGYSPLMRLPSNANNYYGSTLQSSDNNTLDVSDIADVEITTSRWTVYNISRLIISVAELALLINFIHKVNKGHFELSPNEGEKLDVLFAFGTRSVFWAYATGLSILNIYLSSTFNKLANKICDQLNLLYILILTITLIDLRSYYIVKNFNLSFSLLLWTAGLDLLLITIVVNETRLAPTKPIVTQDGRVLSSENWASLYSQFMFSWVNEMMKKGFNGTLDDKDLMELPANNRTKHTLKDYKKHKTTKSIALTCLKVFKWPLFLQFLYTMGSTVFVFGPPYFLNQIVKYIEDPKGEPATTAFLYVAGLFLTNVIQSLLLQQGLYIGRVLGIRIQSIIIGEVFSKSLRRRDESSSPDNQEKGTDAKSNVNNLLSIDTQKVAEIAAYIFYFYCYPFQIVVSVVSLYRLLGNAALWGVVVMICCQPITYWFSRMFESCQSKVMTATDSRLKLTTELLSAIRIVKFFAWESEFKKRIIESREKELGAIRSRLMMFMWMINVWVLVPILIMVTTFYVYTSEARLTASIAFTTLALFNTFRAALDEFPLLVSFLLQANISLNRVQSFLDEDEVSLPAQVSTDAANHGVVIGFINNASFSWENKKDAEPSIKNINLNFPVGKLSIICGPTGSGKSTLIASLLGETHRLSGQAILPRFIPNATSPLGGAVSGIAYVAQSAWLQNCSIRDNILFGLPFDEERYEAVLYMTALTRDLEILEFGDATEVGEKGITLSGGQKQRVAIARAVYSQASTVIFDDCLSAVDAHTAKHLYEHCLTGSLMKHRTILLVTHHVGLCLNGADYVVAMKDGSVVQAGAPKELLQSGALGEELSKSHEDKKNMNEETAVEGPIPTIPKYVGQKKNDGKGGKLVQDEERAEGGVTWTVYDAYIKASGGYIFWLVVLLFFIAAQMAALGQDYWIKVWSAAYGHENDHHLESNTTQAVGVFSTHQTTFSVLSQSGVFSAYAGPVASIMQGYKNVTEVDVTYYLGVYFLIGVGTLILTSLRTFVLFSGSLKASRRLHSELLSKILRAKVRFYDTTPMGRIVNRFSSDLATVDQEVSPSLSFLIYSIMATICVIILISTVTPAFLVPGVVIALLFIMIGNYYLRTSRDLKRLNSVSRSPIYVQFSEAVNGVATIRAFGSQFRFMNENHNKIDSNNRPFLWMWATNRWLHCRVDFLGAFVGFCTGIVLVMARGWIDPGLAGLSLSYSLTFTHNILWVVRQYAMNEMNMNSIERVNEYLNVDEEPPALIPETEPNPSWPEEGAVEVDNLVMQYSPENPPVLRNVSFKIRPREKIGIVGRTGSGKSTLALSLFRFMEPTSGTIKIDGVDIHKIGLHTLRSKLTIIPQDPVLFSGTLRSNLDPFDQHTDAELWAALKRSHLMGEDSTISLDSVVAENGANWSQGQKQLIALARALVKSSALIILDEATSSVDFDTDHKIQQTIRTEFVDSALLCIAHRIRTVADYDRILVLDHGEVKEFDTPYNLMTQEGSIFQQMCLRSGEYDELLAIAKAKK